MDEEKVEKPKQEAPALFQKLMRKWNDLLKVLQLKKQIKKKKKEILENYLKLGRITYTAARQEVEDNPSSVIMQVLDGQLKEVEMLEREIQNLKKSGEEKDLIDSLF